MMQKCEVERQVLKNSLTSVQSSPEELAYNLMGEPGYMAVVAGETVHVVKCAPVAVKIRHTERCYNELPVTYQNSSLFLTPKTHILLRTGTIRECTSVLPTMYLVENT